MSKFEATDHGENGTHVRYWCPGCKHAHTVPAARWNWNGSLDSPTLSPSVRHFYQHPQRGEVTTCHYFIRNGVIEYCGDCEHELAGTKQELPDLHESETTT